MKVPDVVGLSETSAKNRLDNFNVTIVYVYSSRTAKGYVAEQSLVNGSKVNKGSSITLKVSAGAAENAWRTSSSWPSGGNTNYTVEYRKNIKHNPDIIRTIGCLPALIKMSIVIFTG